MHKADPKWVEAAASLLERTHDLFFEQFTKAGFEPQPLRQKLVCVLLGSPEEFAQYLERVRDSAGQPPAGEQPAAGGGQVPAGPKRPVGLGSYSERTNRIQMCDIRAIPRKGDRPGDAARADPENVARIAHEAAHQLSFNCGILTPRGGCPLWLAEGLAANFEFSDAARPFGPLTDNFSPRAGRLKQLYAAGETPPLRQVVTQSPYESRQPGNKGANYVMGWGLFRFLFTERPGQLKRYASAVADRPRNAREALAAFEAAFGPVDELEVGWRQFLKRLSAGGAPAPPSLPAAPAPPAPPAPTAAPPAPTAAPAPPHDVTQPPAPAGSPLPALRGT
ncbi:MAG: DUF1570 domain-containing protein [Planctomycetes bacterium]|nr:DUF1570 domain-containing protein [Planctomycetota bacterium]